VPSLAAGSYPVTASYSGAPAFAGSVGLDTLAVGPAASTTKVPVTPSALTATVTVHLHRAQVGEERHEGPVRGNCVKERI
jgi:hypothetical protein